LQQFCQEKDGLKLAQIDLENRGAGNLLGYEQSGLHLVFASWTNAAILQEAQAKLAQEPNYQSFLSAYLQSKHTSLQMNGN
jgi:RecG-like helicase